MNKRRNNFFMKVLVINAGSSSIKYQLLDMSDHSVIAKGLCERIGITGGHISHKTESGIKVEADIDFPTHAEAFDALKNALTSGEGKVIEDLSEIDAVGHRIVNGGEVFIEPTLVTDEMVAKFEQILDLAPLHNPGALTAIQACRKIFGDAIPEVTVFDTSFHQTMPSKAYRYGIPTKYYEEDSVRRYGFHGTSHRYVSARCAELMEKKPEELKIVTCHLGNGSSICAVDQGKCVDTSMGFTPLAGVLMGSRSGDIDASAVLYIMKKHNISPDEMSDILNKQSGLLGISEISSDCRDVATAMGEGNEKATLAIDLLVYTILKYIGSYAAAMGGIDALVFTGGIGENDVDIRADIVKTLGFLGIHVDPEKNRKFSRNEGNISVDGSSVQTFIIPTNEELVIAQDTLVTIGK